MVDFRIAVKSFIVKDDRLLILQRRSSDVQKPSAWEIPGGRLEPGEDPFAGLKRETKEETGLDIDVLNPLSVKHFIRDDGQVITMLIFLCCARSDDVKISSEHSSHDWVNVSEAKEKLTPFLHSVVDDYLMSN